MAIIRKISSADSFVDTAGTALSSHFAPDGSTWLDLATPANNRLVIQASGRLQSSVIASTPNAIAVANPTASIIPAGVEMDHPRFIMRLEGRNATAAAEDFTAMGVYKNSTGSAYLCGWQSQHAALESGNAIGGTTFPVLLMGYQGGGFARFARANPNSGFTVLAGGGNDAVRDELNSAIDVTLYIDEYQMCMSTKGILTEDLQRVTYYAYPPELRRERGVLLGAASHQWHPVILMKSTLVDATGPRINDFTWTYFDWTPRSILPDWKPLENLFIATVDLNFQDSNFCPEGTCGLVSSRAPGSSGPIIVTPPTRVADTPVHVRMIIIDNSINPASLDVTIGPLTYEIMPYNRMQIILPVDNFTTAIKVVGGGSVARLLLFSEIIVYANS